MQRQIAAGEFKAKCLHLLDEVRQSRNEIVITKRGRAVANLVPVAPDRSRARAAAAVEALLNFPRIEGIPGDTVLEWIREGRK